MNSVLELAECWAAPTRVLLLESDWETSRLMADALEHLDCEITIAKVLSDGIAQTESQRFDLIFVDLCSPDGSGIELIRHVKAHSPLTPIAVVVAAIPGKAQISEALSCGLVALLRKPNDISLAQLKNTLSLFKVRHRLNLQLNSVPVGVAA